MKSDTLPPTRCKQLYTDMTNGNCLNVSPLFHRPQVWQDQPLRVQRQPDPAEVATLTTPDRLSSIGSQSRMKNRVSKFYISTICCISCTLQFVLFPQTQKTAGSTTPGSPCTTPSGSSRELVMGPDPPPIEAGKRPLVQGFVNKNSVKTSYPMEVVRLLEYHQSKMPLLSGT